MRYDIKTCRACKMKFLVVAFIESRANGFCCWECKHYKPKRSPEKLKGHKKNKKDTRDKSYV